jgi:hypothetical protein
LRWVGNWELDVGVGVRTDGSIDDGDDGISLSFIVDGILTLCLVLGLGTQSNNLDGCNEGQLKLTPRKTNNSLLNRGLRRDLRNRKLRWKCNIFSVYRSRIGIIHNFYHNNHNHNHIYNISSSSTSRQRSPTLLDCYDHATC